MTYRCACGEKGCDFVAVCQNGLKMTATWVWSHQALRHPSARPEMTEIEKRCVLVDDATPEQGMPGSAYAAGFGKDDHRTAGQSDNGKGAAS